MSLGGCSSNWTFNGLFPSVLSPNAGSTNETEGNAHSREAPMPAAPPKNWSRPRTCSLSRPRNIAVVGKSKTKFVQETWRLSSKSRIVPVIGLYPPGGGTGVVGFGNDGIGGSGGMISAVVRWPNDVAARP